MLRYGKGLHLPFGLQPLSILGGGKVDLMMNTASGLGIAVLWTAILISTVGLSPLWSSTWNPKPLGCQTLLDPLLIDCYGTALALIHFSGVIFDPGNGWMSSFDHLCLGDRSDFQVPHLFGSIWPSICWSSSTQSWFTLQQVLSKIEENVLVISFRVTAIGLASLLIGLAYLLNEIPKAYDRLTQEYELTESQNMIGIVLAVTTLLLIVAFQALSGLHPENHQRREKTVFLPVDVILGMMVLGRLTVILMTYYFTDIKQHNVKPFIIPSSGCFYSIGIICKKASLRNYVKRQLNIFYDRHLKSMADKIGLRSVQTSAVHPTTKPVEALTTKSV